MSLEDPPSFTTKDLLLRGRERIERGWCQWSFAQDEAGNALDNPQSDKACAFCIRGAMAYPPAFYTEALYMAHRFLEDAATEYTGKRQALVSFNDHPGRTVEDILAAFDIALRRADLPTPTHTP